MTDKQDMRFKILEYLHKNGSSTEEVQLSDFLWTIHRDLGTIKRTLIELIAKGYINVSNVNWETEKESKSVIFKINADGSTGELNNRPERLQDRNDIKEIRLYLTLDGKRFLIEAENLRRTTWMIKHDFKIKLLLVFLAACFTLGIQYVSINYLRIETKQGQPNEFIPSKAIDDVNKIDTIKNNYDTLRK